MCCLPNQFEFRVVLLLNCLSTKARGSSLSCYFSHRVSGEEMDSSLFQGHYSQVNTTDLTGIWIQPADFNFHTKNFSTCTDFQPTDHIFYVYNNFFSLGKNVSFFSQNKSDECWRIQKWQRIHSVVQQSMETRNSWLAKSYFYFNWLLFNHCNCWTWTSKEEFI